LTIALSAESGSEHPLARAIVEHARAEGFDAAAPGRMSAVRGLGIEADVGGRRLLLGSAKLLSSRTVVIPEDAAARAEVARQSGKTVSLAALDGVYAGMWVIGDSVKSSAKDVVAQLREMGIRVVMLTGDARTTASAVASELGLREVDVVSDVLPEDKSRVVGEQKAGGAVVAMAGDGINDGPALASADVGIAMGTGSDVAIESAAVTLVKGDLQGIVRALKLGQRTMRNIRQNLVLAFGYNLLAVPVAAGLLYPLGITLNPMIAAAAMSLSSVSVITNALRLRAHDGS
jgi:P-type Cu+ transporter